MLFNPSLLYLIINKNQHIVWGLFEPFPTTFGHGNSTYLKSKDIFFFTLIFHKLTRSATLPTSTMVFLFGTKSGNSLGFQFLLFNSYCSFGAIIVKTHLQQSMLGHVTFNDHYRPNSKELTVIVKKTEPTDKQF